MNLNDLPGGSLIFIDANIFIYHFTGLSIECRSLLERVERKEVRALTGAHVVLEVLHRMMMIEAVSKALITPGQPAKKLKQHPGVIQKIGDYNRCPYEIRRIGARILPVTSRQIRDSEAMRANFGLMTNDSVTAAMMFSQGVAYLASLDSDLSRVPGLVLCRPTDLP
ncbi:MAG: PIN domain-containing protein [Acidobacteriota bacterium]